MIISNVRILDREGSLELAADVLSETARDGVFTLWYRFPPGFESIEASGDPFLAALLVPLLHQGEDVVVLAPVSRKLLRATDRVMALLSSWYDDFSPVSVTAEETREVVPEGKNVGAFFSAGLDSFYTLLKNLELHPADEDSISHLITIRGFDLQLTEEDETRWTELMRAATEVGEATGKTVLPVWTNMREHTNAQTSWGRRPPGHLWGRALHGSLLASVGLCFGGAFRRIMISSGYHAEIVNPWGSHPDLDTLWSTEATETVHEGLESSRYQKLTRQVAKSPLALAHLRTCWGNRGRYNCGTCQTCVLQMISLELAGVLPQAKQYVGPIPYEKLYRFKIFERRCRVYYDELLIEARKAGRDDLVRIIQNELVAWRRIPARIRRELGRLAGRGKTPR
jgi:hypothetical protein